MPNSIAPGAAELEPAELRASTSMQIGFRIAADAPWLTLAPGTLAETLIDFNACTLPGASAVLRQLVVVRGALLPVFDLCAWLGWPPISSARLLAIGTGDRAAAILIHDEPRIIDVLDGAPATNIVPIALSEVVTAAMATDGAPLWRFDHERWFAQALHSRPQTLSETALFSL